MITSLRNQMKKKLRKTNELRDTTPPNSSRQYVGPLRGCVKTHHSKLATRCNLCKHNKTKLVKRPRAKTPAPVEEVQTANSKMICQRCPQLRQELQRTRDNVLLIEGLLEEEKKPKKLLTDCLCSISIAGKTMTIWRT